MSRLAPELFDRRFDDLVALGRSQLPALAPEWTDHNAHDPGITLMELLAWVAEAQLYSLGRTRRDERMVFAALLGLEPNGTRSARGLIWPDRADPVSPAATYSGSRIIETDAAVHVQGYEEPIFYPTGKTLWIPGRIVALQSRLADGSTRDVTASNDRGTPFLPFGDRAGSRDTFVLEFETHSDEGLFPARRDEARGAMWAIGVRADGDDAGGDPVESAPCHGDAIAVSLVAGARRFSLPVLDTTFGLLRTGVLMLDLSSVTESPRAFRIELRAPRGFARPPRWLRIEPSVLSIAQQERVERELHVANGQPDFTLDLNVPGLSFESEGEPLVVEVRTDTDFQEWQRCDRLSEQGPHDCFYELDTARARVLFGNGLNGRRPGPGAQVYVSYRVSRGQEGNVARSRKWTVTGFSGAFGVNVDPVAGGAGQTDAIDLRREGRREARASDTLVTAADIAAAARKLPLLDVARAWVVTPHSNVPQTGTLTLIALRVRAGGVEPPEPPETARWLEVVRRGLAGRMPLGTRLVVAAPRYADFLVRADLEVEVGYDPAAVEQAASEILTSKLGLVQSRATPQPLAPGVPVARFDVAAWLLGVGGVRRIVHLALVAGRVEVDEIKVPRGGLPRLQIARSTIQAMRPESRSRT